MTHPSALDRRTFIKGAAAVTAGAAVTVRGFDPAVAAEPARHGIFGYGVASGDPTADSVVIWTRATPPTKAGEPVAAPGSGLGKSLNVTWEVATDADFTQVVKEGNVHTSPDSDHTVKVDVTGLQPYTAYWYRFKSKGITSRVGRTQTAGDEPGTTHALRFALASCSNYTGGWFTAYRELARRDDLDFVLHVGDYIYEYGEGTYGTARVPVPTTEVIDLEGYRLRHALHKADLDLQAAHAKHAWITIFDDHEVANNAWAAGAENHESDEGSYLTRRNEAMQAYLEWMPFRMPDQEEVPHEGTRFFKKFTFGDLADLSVVETRQNRSEQVSVPGADGFVPMGVPQLDAARAHPGRHLPEPAQLAWLKDTVASTGRAWHLVGNQVMVVPFRLPGFALGASGTLVNGDAWDGYVADQRDLLAHLGAQPAAAGDTVVLTGDIHSSWACDLPSDPTIPAGPYTSVGVEFVTPSVTSNGFYELSEGAAGPGATPEQRIGLVHFVEGAIRQGNPWTKYLDGIGHGFVVIDVTPERVQADYHHTPVPTSAMPDPRIRQDVVPSYARSMQTLSGSRAVSAGAGELGPRSDQPHGA